MQQLRRHRATLAIAVSLVAIVVLARIAYPALLSRTVAALAAFLAAIALGGVVAWSGDATWALGVQVVRESPVSESSSGVAPKFSRYRSRNSATV